MNRHIIVWTLLCAASSLSGPAVPCDKSDVKKEMREIVLSASAARILERIVTVDDGRQSVSTNNSRVVVETAAIKEVVRGGLANVPPLMEIMRVPDLSCDAFARCYSACDQILDKEDDLGRRVLWYGGCETS
jgi:hypothetical protein